MGRLVAYQHLVDSVLERLVFYGRRKCITSGTKQVSSYLPCLWVGEEKEPKSNSNKDFQHDITSFSLTIRVMVARARPVCSLIDL